MDPRQMHARAQTLFGDVLDVVTDEQLALPTPCSDWTVADLIVHVDAGNLRVVHLGGRDPIELPDDRITAHAASSAEARAVFDADDGMTRRPLRPRRDLATSIGADTDLDHELGEAIYAATSPILGDSLRGEGRPFGVQQPCPPERPIADRMAAFLGRPVT